MNIRSVCESYFNNFSILKDETASAKSKAFAVLKVASYFLVVPPIIFGLGYALSHRASQSELNSTPITQSRVVSLSASQNVPTVKARQSFFNRLVMGFHPIPVVDSHREGQFVDVLNQGAYRVGNKEVIVPPAQAPKKFSSSSNFSADLKALKEKYSIDSSKEVQYSFKDKTTEEAIARSHSGLPIALNFANEHHMGGGPGFHKDPATGSFVYDAKSARAQEESIAQRSDLMASLTQLPHILRADPGTNFVRSFYIDTSGKEGPFDSRKEVYVSDNHLFAVQGKNFYESTYLAEPKSASFVTSAAQYYGGGTIVDCTKDSDVYNDAKQRIQTHLLAAAEKAGASKQENPGKSVELILGAFGCGAFAPENGDEYRNMIAEIYKKLLPQFKGFFDQVTFAVPSFGNQNSSNHRIFKERLCSSKKEIL